MKKTLVLLALGALVIGVGTYYMQNIKLAKQFDFALLGIKNPRYSGNKVTLTVDLMLKNVSNLDASIRNIDISAVVNGAIIGGIKLPQETLIRADNSTVLTFDIVVDAQAVKSSLSDLVKTYIGTKNFPVDFVGVIQYKSLIGWVSLPVKYSTTGRDLYDLWVSLYKTPKP